MRTIGRGMTSLLAIGCALAVLLACKPADGRGDQPPVRTPAVATDAHAVAPAATPVPRLVDLGAGKCIPCKAMAPILEQLREDFAGRMEVQFIDVWRRPEEAQTYAIKMIPTQIFYGADGRELARHEGFISREEILAKWSALGVAF